MKKLILILSLLTLTQFVFSQSNAELTKTVFVEENQSVVFVAEIDAVPLVGLKEWYKKVGDYCADNYPDKAKRAGIQGKVFVSFVIEKDSSLSDVKLLRGYHDLIDKVALNAILQGGDWIPAKQGGRVVRMMKRLPIKFSIPKNNSKKMPVAQIGDMELMKFIHQKSKKYSIKKEIDKEELVMVRILFNEKGFIKNTSVVKSTNQKLNKQALKCINSYKKGWVLPEGKNSERKSIVLPVIFSTKLNLDNL